jgi:phage-related minor tail protein
VQQRLIAEELARGGGGRRLAAGGIVMGPTRALIGESGPEAVIPLGRGGAGVTVTNYITVQGSVWSAGELIDEINDKLMRRIFAQRQMAY